MIYFYIRYRRKVNILYKYSLILHQNFCKESAFLLLLQLPSHAAPSLFTALLHRKLNNKLSFKVKLWVNIIITSISTANKQCHFYYISQTKKETAHFQSHPSHLTKTVDSTLQRIVSGVFGVPMCFNMLVWIWESLINAKVNQQQK